MGDSRLVGHSWGSDAGLSEETELPTAGLHSLQQMDTGRMKTAGGRLGGEVAVGLKSLGRTTRALNTGDGES